jgi:2-polyprenyl-3-methyl-5-hydroxy-6-metoxy-1,4-benzoquinol methylase
MSFARRSYEKELLDRPDIPFADIEQNMRELNTVNTLLGGHAITQRGLMRLLQQADVYFQEPLHIVEVGCGGGDNLRVLQKMLERKHIPFRLTGIDMKQECIDFAKAAFGNDKNIDWICSDYRAVHFETMPGIIFSSLFCHHFTDEELVAQLQWLQNNSRTGFFINDLQRHPLAYHSIRLLTRIFSKSYLVKNDAPLSVKRGFSKQEWEALLKKAGVHYYSISWQWAFRYLVIVRTHE